MDSSVVIVTCNSSNVIGDCLESLMLAGSFNTSAIIVVDNASKDNTCELVKSYPCRLIALTENVGFSKACNIGAQASICDYILFLNPDTQVCTYSIPKMLSIIMSDHKIDAVGPLSNMVAGSQRVNLYVPESLEFHNPSNRNTVDSYLSSRQTANYCETKLLIGFCLLIRRTTFELIGGMDEYLPLGLDDLDLSWRIQLLGRKLCLALNAFVWHKGHTSFDASPSDVVKKLSKLSQDNFSKKLIRFYGSEDKVPSSLSIWGMQWFEITNELDSFIPTKFP